jgi:hypothetical protein
MQIAEGDVVVALGNELRAKFATRDAAEDAILSGSFGHLCLALRTTSKWRVVRSGFSNVRSAVPR